MVIAVMLSMYAFNQQVEQINSAATATHAQGLAINEAATAVAAQEESLEMGVALCTGA